MPSLFQKAREPISSYSHFIGAVLSIFGLAAMSLQIIFTAKSPPIALAALLFCFSLLALYGASSIYHYSRASEKILVLLRKLDHAMIYILIAGTYTPLLLTIFPSSEGYAFAVWIWFFAAGGIGLKLCWIDAPRWFGTLLYLLMGWAVLIRPTALASLSPYALTMLIAGGIFYTIGGVIYWVKRPNLSLTIGFHELFHLFVIAGSVCHYFILSSLNYRVVM